MKTNVADINSGAQRHAERLNRAVKVHVKQRVLIMPDAGGRISYFVAHKPNSVVAWIRLHLAYSCASICPCLDGGLHSHCVASLIEYEIRRTATDRKLLVREIVKHVALARMRLAPGELMRSDVGSFAVICRAGVLRRIEIRHVREDAMRYPIMVMAAVIISSGWKRAGKRIDPCA